MKHNPYTESLIPPGDTLVMLTGAISVLFFGDDQPGPVPNHQLKPFERTPGEPQFREGGSFPKKSDTIMRFPKNPEKGMLIRLGQLPHVIGIHREIIGIQV